MKKVIIGADPEFMILTNNNIALPSREICDDGDTKNHFGREIGQNGYVFELRPDPSTDIFSLLANIRKILKIHIEELPYLKKCMFIGGHAVKIALRADKYGAIDNCAIGGHIHISSIDKDDLYKLDNREFRYFLNTIIFNGFMYIINDKENHTLRRAHTYGYSRDFRQKAPNGGSTIEYRTPPSWLVSPTLAFMFLTLAKICGLLYINKEIWKVGKEIDDILKGSCRGLNLLKKLSTLVETNREMIQEKDIAKCIELLNHLPRKVKLLTWQKDFKAAWQL